MLPKIPEQPAEVFQGTVAILAKSFDLRRPDAMPKAIAQVKQWRERRKGAILRGDRLSSQILRQFYRNVEELIRKNIGRYVPKEGHGPTPEMALRPISRDSIGSLEDAGRITHEQAHAAREIQRIIEIITSRSKPKCQTYQKGAQGNPMAFMTAETAYRWSCVYRPWHIGLDHKIDPRAKKLALLVIVDGHSLDSARRACRMSYEKGHEFLVDALDLYIEIREKEASEIDKIRSDPS